MRFDLNRPVPILLLADSPSLLTGLARIAHDVAWFLSTMPEFQVGVLGRGGTGRSHFPWVSYDFGANEQWGEGRLVEVWNDLSQGRRGIVMSIWDATRLLWFADPIGMPQDLQNLLSSGSVERWGLFMSDSEGVLPGKLPLTAGHVKSKYDRILMASKWSYGITKNTLPNHPDIDWLPHPINTNRFSPQDRMHGRSALGVGEKEVLIGCVMANQERKHFPTVFEALARMRATTAGKPKMWVHTNIEMLQPGIGYWNLLAMIHEYGLDGRVFLDTRPLDDKGMAMYYSACDATVLISGGEGFGYPIAESLSCGVPCLTGAYAAGSEIASHSVAASGFKIETQHNVKRSYYEAALVAQSLEMITDSVRAGEWEAEQCRGLVEHLAGDKLGKLYQQWFRKGLQ